MADAVPHKVGADLEQKARVALEGGRFVEAARLFLEAHMPYEAAVCFEKGQSPKDCLSALLSVPQGSPQYRRACVQATRIAFALGDPLKRLSPFILPFLALPPASPVEAAALCELAQEFASMGRRQQARAIYARVAAAFPADTDAKEALATLPDIRETVATTSKGKRLSDILLDNGKLTRARLQLVLKEVGASLESNDVALGEALVVNAAVSELDVLQALSAQSGIPYISTAQLLACAEPEAARTLTVEQAERWGVVPLALIDRQLAVAMRKPQDIAATDQLRFASGVTQIIGVIGSEAGIRRGIRKLYYGEEPGAEAADDWRKWEE